MIDIYSQNGQLKCSIEPGSSSEQQKALQGDNVLSLSFTLYEAVMLDVNDYTDFCGERYWVTERYLPKQNSTVEWTYDVKLYGIESLIKRFLVLQNSDGENEAVFTLTAPAREHAAMIIEAINKGMGTTRWKVGSVIATENLTIDYEGTYCNEGLEKVAKEVGTEYWFEGTTLNICKAETGTQLELGYGRGLLSLERDVADNVKFYTRLFPIGSTRNIDPSKYGHTCLQLPDSRKYIDKDVDKYGVIHHYEKEAFKEIYPRRIGVVSSVRSVNRKGDDGKEFTIYYFKDDALSFDPNKYELAGKVKHVVFQSGELDGRDFEVNYDSGKKEFEIITTWPYKDGTQLPGGMLVPARGDRYILWNLRMPDEYYPLAEKEFLHAVETFNREHYIDRSVYKAPTDHVWVEDNDAELLIGRRVKLYSDKYFPETGYRSSRITKITRKVALPSQADLDISDALSTGTMDKIEDSIGALKSYVRQTASALPDIIRTIDDTLPTDNNLFSARRILQDFLSKNRPGTLSELITFLKGIALGRNYSIDNDGNAILNLIRSVGIENVGDIITKNLTVTGKMNIFELIIDHIKSAGGALLMTPADGFTIDKVAPVGTDGSELKSTEEIRSIQKPIDENSIAGYRLYWKATDGSKARRNMWKVGDQALCKTDNLAEGTTHNAANKEYWCAVTDRNPEGKTVSTEIDGRMYECNYITISTRNKLKNCVVNPAVGDEIVMLGYQGTDDPDRQSAVYLSAHSSLDTGLRAPLLGFYRGINDFDLASHRTSYFDARKGKFVGELEVVTENGPVPIEDYIKDKVSVNVETYRLIPSQTVINTGKEETITLSVVHQTGKVVKIVSQSIAHFGILATFYPMAGTPVRKTFSVGEKITSKYLRDNGYLRADLALQKDIDTPQPIDLDKCTITTVSDGVNGKNGYTLYLSPAHIILDTDSNGLVPPAAISSVSSVVHVLNGNAEVEASEIQAVTADAKGCKASTDTVEVGGKSYSCIKLVSIDAITDESGTYSNPLSTVDVTVKLKNGTSLVSRMEVTVNLHKVMANFKVQQNKITQRVTSIESDTSQIKSGIADMNTRIAELQVADGQITAEVKAVKGIVGNHTESITKLSVKQGEIDLSIKEASAPRNLLSGTAFRFEKDFEQNNVDHPCHISDTEKYKGTNCLVVDVNETIDVYSGVIFRKIPVTPGKTYTFSFWGKKDGAHVPDAFGSEAKAYKSNGEHADPFRLFVDYVSPSEGWQRFEKTFTATGDVSYIEILIWVIKKGKAYIARPMLEEGDRYTGWTPSPLDDIDAVKRCGVNVNAERIELDGKSVFKNGHAPEVPLFDEKGKINPNLSAAQYLMEVLKSMETVIDGGLVMAGLIAAKDAGGNVTAYLNGLRQKMYALAAGVKNFGKDNETSLSHIGFDGSAQFGNLGIAYDGRVSIIDEAGKPRINVTPKGLPSDGELLKTADTDITQPLPEMAVKPTNWQPEITGGTFTVANDNSDVTLTGELIVNARVNSGLPDGVSATSPLPVLLLRNRHSGAEVYLGQWSFRSVVISDGEPNGISDRKDILITRILSVGTWTLVMQSYHGGNVHEESIFLTSLQVNISHKSGAQALSLARNGWSVVQSEKQAAYVRDGKLCAVGAMNIPGILLAGTVNRLGQLSNAWGEFAPGTSLQYTSYGGVQVMRLTFYNPLPCGANYVAIVNPNDDTSPYGCMPVVRHKTANYCDFRVVNDSGGEVSNVGLDFMIIGRNK